MLIIGLTGGIGSGKSTVAKMFTALGVPVIDMDHIARQIVEPDQPALDQIAREFGTSVLDTDGRLNRRKLRELIFDSVEKRRRLETILHPLIRQETQRQISELDAAYCIIVIPLLLETDQRSLVDRILVVDVPETLQITRTVERDGVSVLDVQKILIAQVDRKSRLAAADDVIDNSAGLEQVQIRVSELDQEFRSLASSTS